jgi:hypothetical protein
MKGKGMMVSRLSAWYRSREWEGDQEVWMDEVRNSENKKEKKKQ